MLFVFVQVESVAEDDHEGDQDPYSCDEKLGHKERLGLCANPEPPEGVYGEELNKITVSAIR